MKHQWSSAIAVFAALFIAACGGSGDPSAPACGDGIVTAPEACDDQNTADGDGCSASCEVEAGFACTGQPSECDPVATCDTDCSELNDGCTVGVCEEGTCVARPADDGVSCDDGNLCTSDDVCSEGVCVGAELDCSDRDAGCVVGVCDPESGECVDTVAEDGTSCDDGDACTGDGVCAEGVCTGAEVDCTEFDSACSVGVCDPEQGCVAEPLDDGTSCDDESLCTANDVCTAGECVGEAVECPDAGVCGTSFCDPETGACAIDPVEDGTACDDGSICTDDEACLAGVCTGTQPDCTEFDSACSVGTCDPISGECGAEPLPDGATCDDGSACTDDEACLAGECVGTQPDCSAFDGEDICTVGACNPETGECEAAANDDGIFCDDGDLCTLDDVCVSGSCTGRARDCRVAGSPCVVGSCNADTGECQTDTLEDGAGCDDGDICTTGDTCEGGACTGDAVDCAALDTACTAGLCDPITGGCLAIPVADDTSCDTDPDDCSNDICRAGECVPTALEDFRSCDTDPNDCAIETCQGGACVADPAADCQPCGDSLTQVCGGGVCGGQRTRADIGFERGVISAPVSSTGDRSWRVVVGEVFEGSFAARSAALGAFQRSVLSGDVTVDETTTMTFQLLAEFEDAEELIIYLDGEEVATYDENQEWREESITLQPGRNVFQFSFERGATSDDANGAVWIDNIAFDSYDPCASGFCSARVYNGASCVLCALADEGTSCDDDAFDCIDRACDGLGSCVNTSREACDACGEDGDDYCVSGVCGGVTGEVVFNFDDVGAVLPVELVPDATAWTVVEDGFSGVQAIAPTGASGAASTSLEWDIMLDDEGELRFWWKSGDAASTSQLRVNGFAVENEAGAFDWTRVEQTLPAGESLVTWTYEGTLDGVAPTLVLDDIQLLGVDVCESDSACSVELYDGDVCLACPVLDPVCEE